MATPNFCGHHSRLRQPMAPAAEYTYLFNTATYYPIAIIDYKRPLRFNPKTFTPGIWIATLKIRRSSDGLVLYWEFSYHALAMDTGTNYSIKRIPQMYTCKLMGARYIVLNRRGVVHCFVCNKWCGSSVLCLSAMGVWQILAQIYRNFILIGYV